jgi:hypothetical protein
MYDAFVPLFISFAHPSIVRVAAHAPYVRTIARGARVSNDPT